MDGATIQYDSDREVWLLFVPGIDGPAYETTDPLKIEMLLDNLAQQ